MKPFLRILSNPSRSLSVKPAFPGEDFVVLFVFGYFSVQILKYSYLSKDRFSSLVMIGCATVFISHVFVNTAMTVGLIPVKGLPFPFISAGGSFLITSYIMLGLVLKLSINYSD